jgi:hypothetical protein
MGGHAYWYFVPYESNVQRALDALRTREFKAGRYNPVIPFLKFGAPGFFDQAPGAQHRSIDDAMNDAAEDGTRSILDISRVGTRSDFGVTAPVPPDQLEEWFGTDRPTRGMLEDADELFESLDRGQCVYVVVYENGQPSELFFAGYSFD